MDTTKSFRELKARKKKYGFELYAVSNEKCILVMAEMIKAARAIEPDIMLLIDFDSRKFSVYTDNDGTAEYIRKNFC